MKLVALKRPRIVVAAVVEFDEDDLRVLDALTGYSDDGFLKFFYEKMGRAYLEPHEKAFRRLFPELRRISSQALSTADKARQKLREP